MAVPPQRASSDGDGSAVEAQQWPELEQELESPAAGGAHAIAPSSASAAEHFPVAAGLASWTIRATASTDSLCVAPQHDPVAASLASWTEPARAGREAVGMAKDAAMGGQLLEGRPAPSSNGGQEGGEQQAREEAGAVDASGGTITCYSDAWRGGHVDGSPGNSVPQLLGRLDHEMLPAVLKPLNVRMTHAGAGACASGGDSPGIAGGSNEVGPPQQHGRARRTGDNACNQDLRATMWNAANGPLALKGGGQGVGQQREALAFEINFRKSPERRRRTGGGRSQAAQENAEPRSER